MGADGIAHGRGSSIANQLILVKPCFGVFDPFADPAPDAGQIFFCQVLNVDALTISCCVMFYQRCVGVDG